MNIELDKSELDQIAALREMSDSENYKHTEFATLAVHFAAMMIGHVKAIESQVAREKDVDLAFNDQNEGIFNDQNEGIAARAGMSAAYYNTYGRRYALEQIETEKTL